MTKVFATIRDTVRPEVMAIDISYQGVLAYRDGDYRWQPAEAERFHAAGKLVYPISVTGKDPHIAQVVDCEMGALSTRSAAAWARARNELHGDATVYIERSRIPALVDALNGEPCWLWIAWWIGEPRMPAIALPANVHVAAHQYADLDDWDMSAILSSSWPAHPFTDFKIW
jgi:hypothetical protein